MTSRKNASRPDTARRPSPGVSHSQAIATLAPLLTKDPPQFWQCYGLHRTGSQTEIGVDRTMPTGGASGAGQGGSESSLDVEQSRSMAPGANIEVYVAPNTNSGFIDLFNGVVNRYHGVVPNVMSVSWGEAEHFETRGYAVLMNHQFEQGAAEGICRSGLPQGDSAARRRLPGGLGRWLCGLLCRAGLAGAAGKGFPDVSLNADPYTGYSIYDSSSSYTTAQAGWTDGWGGTSFASPNWVGITALLDQSAGPPLGFLPPTLYAIANQGGLQDVPASSNWHCQAGTGWDAATGLGVPNVARLAQAIQAYSG